MAGRFSAALLWVVAVLMPVMTPATSCAAINEWTSLGPDGGRVDLVAIDPQKPGTVYAGSRNAGIFKTTNGGATWVKSGPTHFVSALIVDPKTPSTLYAVTGFGQLSKSTDAGASWNTATSGLPQDEIRSLAIDPKTPGIVYATTYHFGLFKSTDGAESWIGLGSPAGLVPMGLLRIDQQNPNTLYATVDSSSGGLFKSSDGGESWVKVSLPGVLTSALAIDPQNSSTVYAGWGSGVVKSTDGGESWNTFNSGPTFRLQSLAVDPQNSDTLYAAWPPSGSNSGLFKSTDGGSSWSAATSGLPQSPFYTIAIDPVNPNTLYVGTENAGVFKSTDGAATWNAVNSGLRAASIGTLVVHPPQNPSAIYAGLIGVGLFRTADEGTTWSFLNSELEGLRFIDPQNPRTIYAIVNGRVFKSIDGGESWVDTGFPTNVATLAINPRGVTTLAIDPQNSEVVYAGTFVCSGICGGRVFKSTDGGRTWITPDFSFTERVCSQSISSLAIDPRNTSTVYAATSDCNDQGGALWKSIDGGTSWGRITYVSGYGNPLAIDPQGTVYVNNGGIARSTNSGESWTALNPGLPDAFPVSSLAIDPLNPSTVYAGTFGGGVFALTIQP